MRKWLVIPVLLMLSSCQFVRRLADGAEERILGDEVVARVGEHKLFLSELEKVIPGGISPEDSTSLARQYIYTWAKDLLFLDLADEQLSKDEKDVSMELEQYRRSLLKYRYTQHYVSERLDTLVTEEEKEAYYEAHSDKFLLDKPLMRCRILLIPNNSKSLKKILSKMRSEDSEDLAEAEELSKMTAIRYADLSDSWIDATALSRELGMDADAVLSALKKGKVEWEDDGDVLHYAYIVEKVKEGKPAPYEYVSGRIGDIILNIRKHTLTSDLERDLLERARTNGQFVEY
jgi:hypothetical protein